MSDDMKPCPFCGDKTPAARIRATLQPRKEVMPLGPDQTENLRRPVDTSPGVTAGATAALVDIIRWAHDTLYEINPDNYDHDEVCKLNAASVEVILGLAPILGEKHGKTDDWWQQRAALAAFEKEGRA